MLSVFSQLRSDSSVVCLTGRIHAMRDSTAELHDLQGEAVKILATANSRYKIVFCFIVAVLKNVKLCWSLPTPVTFLQVFICSSPLIYMHVVLQWTWLSASVLRLCCFHFLTLSVELLPVTTPLFSTVLTHIMAFWRDAAASLAVILLVLNYAAFQASLLARKHFRLSFRQMFVRLTFFLSMGLSVEIMSGAPEPCCHLAGVVTASLPVVAVMLQSNAEWCGRKKWI